MIGMYQKINNCLMPQSKMLQGIAEITRDHHLPDVRRWDLRPNHPYLYFGSFHSSATVGNATEVWA